MAQGLLAFQYEVGKRRRAHDAIGRLAAVFGGPLDGTLALDQRARICTTGQAGID